MKDGTIDVQCFTGPAPSSAMMDTASFAPIRILTQTEETLNTILTKYPYYIRDYVPGGVYDGVTEDALTFGVVYCIMCQKDTPDEVVNEFLDQVLQRCRKEKMYTAIGLYEINLLRFHRMGATKWEQRGKKYEYSDHGDMPEERMLELQERYLNNDIACYIGEDTPF